MVDRAAHCLRSFDIDADPDGVAASTLAGRCDLAGVSDGPAVDARFDGPTHVLVAADGALYVSDTDNHRVVRAVRDAAGTLVVTTILGTGVASSFGDGAPAATLPVARPGPLALDDAGNLWVGSADVLRVVTDRDDDGLATGNDAVRTVDPGLRGGNRTCIEALVQRGVTLLVGDACNGRVLAVESTLVPLPGGPP